MSYHPPSARYVENDVLSRSQEWLVPLLYEHLLKELRRISVQLENGDEEGRAKSVGQATVIVGELLATLDRDKGGELAERLASLYVFFTLEILKLAGPQGAESLPRLIRMIEELHGAWVEAAQQVAPRGPTRGIPA